MDGSHEGHRKYLTRGRCSKRGHRTSKCPNLLPGRGRRRAGLRTHNPDILSFREPNFADLREKPQANIHEMYFPTAASWNTIIRQYARGPIEAISLEIKTPQDPIIPCTLAFRSSDISKRGISLFYLPCLFDLIRDSSLPFGSPKLYNFRTYVI